jgi:dCTP diphosphatase
MNIKKIQDKIAKFANERDWEQFHSPKNLAMALTSEAGELSEIFQWLTEDASFIKKNSPEYDQVKHELADILIYLIRIADKLDVELEEAVLEKIKINADKYPIKLAKGNAKKYDKLKALIHRYDNEPDILEVEKNGCSEVYWHAKDSGHEIVIVVPTTAAKTETAIWGEATSEQYTPKKSTPWPGRPDRYPFRVDMKNFKYTNLHIVRWAAIEAGIQWQAPWPGITANIDTSRL